MTRREELQKAYEDAMFALLMDYVAESEGKKALEENRALQEDPDAEVPQEVRRACLKEINRAFRKQSARSVGRITMKVINKVAIVALVGTLLFSTAFAVSPEFRAGTLNMLVNTLNESVDFQFSSGSVPEKSSLEDLKPSWVPEGYELVEEDNFVGAHWTYYCTDQGDRLNIDMLSGSGTTTIDTENAKITPITIYGIPAYLIDQIDTNGIVKVIITNAEENYLINITSIPASLTSPVLIGQDDIIRIAESLFE